MTSACHLLSLVDARDERTDLAAHKAAVAVETRELANLRRDYRESANSDAQLIYFLGMAFGICLLALLYASANSLLQGEGVEDKTIIGCLVAGALGAVVSVIARINSGTFALDTDVQRGYTLFLGALRPVIGSVFGLLSFFMLTSKFVQFFDIPPDGLDRPLLLPLRDRLRRGLQRALGAGHADRRPDRARARQGRGCGRRSRRQRRRPRARRRGGAPIRTIPTTRRSDAAWRARLAAFAIVPADLVARYEELVDLEDGRIAFRSGWLTSTRAVRPWSRLMR